MQGKLNRVVTKAECGWLERDLPEGTVVHRYTGATYGCIGNGDAVSEKEGETPFFEVPADAVTWQT